MGGREGLKTSETGYIYTASTLDQGHGISHGSVRRDGEKRSAASRAVFIRRRRHGWSEGRVSVVAGRSAHRTTLLNDDSGLIIAMHQCSIDSALILHQCTIDSASIQH